MLRGNEDCSTASRPVAPIATCRSPLQVHLPPERAALSDFAVPPGGARLRAIENAGAVIQGTNDFQVSVDDAKLLKAAKPDAELVVIEGA